MPEAVICYQTRKRAACTCTCTQTKIFYICKIIRTKTVMFCVVCLPCSRNYSGSLQFNDVGTIFLWSTDDAAAAAAAAAAAW